MTITPVKKNIMAKFSSILTAMIILSTTACQMGQIQNASLTNTYWKLISLHGKTVIPATGYSELFMELSQDKSSIHGFLGCNRFFGHYSHKDNEIKFTKLASTKMMCANNMQYEQSFVKVLSDSVMYKIAGDNLYLYDDSNHPIAIFRSGATQ